ncbi:MAG: hypothetical protein ACK4NC_06510 [Candidatus Gracilibacteria bacterium]
MEHYRDNNLEHGEKNEVSEMLNNLKDNLYLPTPEQFEKLESAADEDIEKIIIFFNNMYNLFPVNTAWENNMNQTRTRAAEIYHSILSVKSAVGKILAENKSDEDKKIDLANTFPKEQKIPLTARKVVDEVLSENLTDEYKDSFDQHTDAVLQKYSDMMNEKPLRKEAREIFERLAQNSSVFVPTEEDFRLRNNMKLLPFYTSFYIEMRKKGFEHGSLRA